MVFDHAGKYLYISTVDGFVQRYNVEAQTFDAPYNVGGVPAGLDISPDDSFLLVADYQTSGGQGTIHKLDLNSGGVTDIHYNLYYPEERGAWEIAIMANNLALFTSDYSGSAHTPLRQLDLATNVVSRRTDMPGFIGDHHLITQQTQVYRSADYTRAYFLESNISNGPVFTYDAATNNFSRLAVTNLNVGDIDAGVSRDGALIATAINHLALDTAADLASIHSFGAARSIHGVAFDAVRDIVYRGDVNTSEVVGYDTHTFVEKFRIPIGEDYLPLGRQSLVALHTMVTSPDGRWLALSTRAGIRLLRTDVIGNPRPVVPARSLADLHSRMSLAFDHAGNYLYISTSDGLVQRYRLATGQFEKPINLGGSPAGLDISADDKFLFVAQGDQGVAEGRVQKVNLATRQITNIAYQREYGEGGAVDIAVASNHTAFFSTGYLGSGETPLRQFDTMTSALTERSDVPDGSISGLIYRSADHNTLLLMDGSDSSNRFVTYTAGSDSFSPSGYIDFDTGNGAQGAMSRDGSIIGTLTGYGGLALGTVADAKQFHQFSDIDYGVAFDSVRDIVYGYNSSAGSIIGYDTKDFGEKFRKKINWPYDDDPEGRVHSATASQDGRYFGLINLAGVTLVPTVINGTANLVNLSTRGLILGGDDVLIAGFIVTGDQPRKVALRAIAPSLTNSGVANALPNPRLELHDGSGIIDANDDWASASNGADIPAALRPADPRESVIVRTLAPGSYTAVVQGTDNTTGVGLVEAYDLDAGSTSRLANLSTRGFVDEGPNPMIGGFIAQGGDGISQIVVRALGASLANSGVSNPLLNPSVELHDINGTLVETNDDWQNGQKVELQKLHLAPSGDHESAILATLTAGAYTAVVRGVGGSIGTGLVEIYDLQ